MSQEENHSGEQVSTETVPAGGEGQKESTVPTRLVIKAVVIIGLLLLAGSTGIEYVKNRPGNHLINDINSGKIKSVIYKGKPCKVFTASAGSRQVTIFDHRGVMMIVDVDDLSPVTP